MRAQQTLFQIFGLSPGTGVCVLLCWRFDGSLLLRLLKVSFKTIKSYHWRSCCSTMIITGASQSNHPNSPHHRPTTKSTVKSRINCTDHKIAAMPRLTALDLLEAQGLPRHMYLLSAEEAATLDREALEDDCDAVFQVSHST